MMYTSTAADKEDLYQEICLQLWRSFRYYRNESKFSTWLYRVSLNTAISSVRKSNRRVETVLLDHSKHFISRESEKEETTRMLFRALSRLNKVDRAVILLWLMPHVLGDMRIPVLAYTATITLMLVAAVGTHGFETDWRIPLGAAPFYVSDLAVARDRFVAPGWDNRLWGLPLYFGGQLLLAWAAGG